MYHTKSIIAELCYAEIKQFNWLTLVMLLASVCFISARQWVPVAEPIKKIELKFMLRLFLRILIGCSIFETITKLQNEGRLSLWLNFILESVPGPEQILKKNAVLSFVVELGPFELVL